MRAAQPGDAATLAACCCSTGAWYEDEVEEYIRTRAIGHAAAKDGYHLLVACEGPGILALLGHADEALISPEGDTSWAARLQVMAIATTDHGRELPLAGRLSDVLMATLIADALRKHQTEVVTAIVAEENHRSIALCERWSPVAGSLRAELRSTQWTVHYQGGVDKLDSSATRKRVGLGSGVSAFRDDRRDPSCTIASALRDG